MPKEELWDVPNNWQWTQIAELGEVVSGGTPSTKEPEYWGNEVNWITPADLSGYSAKYISKGARSLTKHGLQDSSAKSMPRGSVHFSSRAPVGYVVISSESLSTNQGFKSLVPMSGLFNEFLYYYLRSAKQLAQRRASGTTFKELSGAAFSKLPIPLAPEGEQHRIVEKIEELLSELDKGIESLKTAREQLKVYRQAVLKHAFEGKLTEKWRRDHASELPSAEAVLEKTKGERERRHEEQLGEWKKALKAWESGGHKGRTPAKPAKPRELQHLTKTELADLPALPEGWGYVRAESISDFITKGTTPKENDLFAEKGDVPFIRDYILDAGNTSISR